MLKFIARILALALRKHNGGSEPNGVRYMGVQEGSITSLVIYTTCGTWELQSPETVKKGLSYQ